MTIVDYIELRLVELRAAIEEDNISYGELAELQRYAGFIRNRHRDDTTLCMWAGIPEFEE